MYLQLSMHGGGGGGGVKGHETVPIRESQPLYQNITEFSRPNKSRQPIPLLSYWHLDPIYISKFTSLPR